MQRFFFKNKPSKILAQFTAYFDVITHAIITDHNPTDYEGFFCRVIDEVFYDDEFEERFIVQYDQVHVLYNVDEERWEVQFRYHHSYEWSGVPDEEPLWVVYRL